MLPAHSARSLDILQLSRNPRRSALAGRLGLEPRFSALEADGLAADLPSHERRIIPQVAPPVALWCYSWGFYAAVLFSVKMNSGPRILPTFVLPSW